MPADGERETGTGSEKMALRLVAKRDTRGNECAARRGSENVSRRPSVRDERPIRSRRVDLARRKSRNLPRIVRVASRVVPGLGRTVAALSRDSATDAKHLSPVRRA